ncbi:uncharacterized protein LOC131233424 [Magnolia sinica]|uniref:uncharacterized protein LOC131233424 n=1 Tax=Magnolia sinica TaxID=86752 RepID=UPI00265A04C7|nr:uncharacterized protein LOC131233424 [Magnolia sinica]
MDVQMVTWESISFMWCLFSLPIWILFSNYKMRVLVYCYSFDMVPCCHRKFILMHQVGHTVSYGQGFFMNLQPSEAEAGFDIWVPPNADEESLEKRIAEEWAPSSRNLTFEVWKNFIVFDYFYNLCRFNLSIRRVLAPE